MNNSMENQSFNNSIDVSKTKKIGKMSDRQSIIQSILEESMSDDNGIQALQNFGGDNVQRKGDLEQRNSVLAKRGVSPSLVKYGDVPSRTG